jgi:putative colanic acid biosynthesis UDP-glucose lipid carrier transferase
MSTAKILPHRDAQSAKQAERSLRPPVSLKLVVDIVRALDVTAILLAGVLSHFLYFSILARGDFQLAVTASVIGAITAVAVFQYQGLYDPAHLIRGWNSVRNVTASWAIVFLTLLAAAFLLKISATYSRGWAMSWFAMGLTFLVTGRMAIRSAMKRPPLQDLLVQRVAIVGAEQQAQNLIDRVAASTDSARIVGVYENPFADQPTVLPTQGQMKDLFEDIRKEHVSDIILAVNHSKARDIWAITEMLAEYPVTVRLSPDAFDLTERPLKVEKIGSVPTPILLSPPFRDWNRIIKSLEDKVLAAALLLFLAPTFLFIAAAIKLESKGPVFFVQRRHGFNQDIIPVVKFRTMSTLDDGPSIAQATRDDARITRVGSFLRRSSLDELPQIFNVLAGQMSFVGPRPHAIAHNDMYAKMIKAYSKRHIVKPGITGWAQINGYRGEITDISLMEKRVEHDLFYIDNWSLWFDIKIILMTPFRGLFHPNAY